MKSTGNREDHIKTKTSRSGRSRRAPSQSTKTSSDLPRGSPVQVSCGPSKSRDCKWGSNGVYDTVCDVNLTVIEFKLKVN